MRLKACLFAAWALIVIMDFAVVGQPPGRPPEGGPPGRPGFSPPGGPGERRKPPPAAPTAADSIPTRRSAADSIPTRRSAAEDEKSKHGLIANGEMEQPTSDGKSPQGFLLEGDADYGFLGTPGPDLSGWGVRFNSGRDVNGDGQIAGRVTTVVNNLPTNQRWYRLRIRGMAQENFAVKRDQLFLQVEFFKDGGKDPLDQIKKQFYPQIEKERVNLKDAGTNPKLGVPTWRFYEINFRTPFPEVDSLRVGVGFAEGNGKGANADFWIDSIALDPIPEPASLLPNTTTKTPPAIESLIKIGGRWYYDPRGGSEVPPAQFDHTNSERLYYLAGRLEAPFAGNMTAWLKKGWLDREGKTVAQDRFVPDNVIVSFTKTHLVVRSKILPNHPTAAFPDRWRSLDGNPNSIQEKDRTWQIPLDPQVNDAHQAMTAGNVNSALNGGPIGIALNGVVFFNPFDEGAVDAVWRLDRCCGHPSPNSMYHYHKYPVCLNTPWVDDGTDHSPLIGFAFDGFPIYGPYEGAGEMAKSSKSNPLNEFNIHRDDVRGWHYHVTPGQFPHVIGGYWGAVDAQNIRRGPPGRPGGARPGGGAGPPR